VSKETLGYDFLSIRRGYLCKVASRKVVFRPRAKIFLLFQRRGWHWPEREGLSITRSCARSHSGGP